MPFRPSHRQLQYLISVAERGHFGDAAKACHVSQPTLSSQLALLEDQLGAKLIERNLGKASPTPTGNAVLPLARNVLALLDEITTTATQSSENLGRLIRLGVAPTFGPYFLPRFLPRLHKTYPDLEVYIREDRPTSLETALDEGMLDCILTPLPVTGERFSLRELCREQIVLAIPADHRLASAKSISARALEGERLLTLGRGHRLYGQVQDLSDATGAIMREDYEGTSLDALRQMVSIGMGISLFPASYVAYEFAKEENVVLKVLSDWPIERTIAMAWRRDSVRTQQFEKVYEEALAAAREANVTGVETVA